jgi:hypothetical protein
MHRTHAVGGTRVPRLAHPDDLVDPAALEPIVGAIAGITRAPLTTPGFSGSSHERLTLAMRDGSTRTLVLKRPRPEADWLARRTGDRAGREALLLDEPGLAEVWQAFANPCLAWASARGEIALLMIDLAPHLLPDVREPIAEDHEHRLLAALADMHARFWESPVLDRPWLARPDQLIGILSPAAVEAHVAAGTSIPVLQRAAQGWRIALATLPSRLADWMRETPEQAFAPYAHLPRTLTHGDAKVANFAPLPDGRVAAFDWALVGAGPVAMELAWHLAVNASRLSGTREASIARYRRLLEAALGRALGDAFWRDTESLAVRAGAMMLLWSKALALEAGGDRARAEWNWWVERLEASL